MSDELDSLSDDKLSECFAVEVAGWTFVTYPNGSCPHIKHWRDEDGCAASIYVDGAFATVANAVLPWLEKGMATCYREDGEWSVSIKVRSKNPAWDYESLARSTAPSFPRAACIALIRAHRASKSAKE
jgi:hypothetical protein